MCIDANPSVKSRAVRRVLLGAMLSVLAVASSASDFYRLKVIAESSTQAGPDWRLVNFGLGINDAGQVTWTADRFVNGVVERAVFVGDGTNQTLMGGGAPGITAQTSSINNQGKAAFFYSENAAGISTSWVRVYDTSTGSSSDLYTCSQQPNPLPCATTRTFADNSRVTLLINTNPQVWQIVGAGGAATLSATLPSNYLNSNNTHVISRNGLNAASYGRDTAANSTVIGALDSAIPGNLGLLSVGSLSSLAIQGVSTNKLGNIAFLSLKGGSTTAQALVGVVNPRVPGSGVIRVADTSSGTFVDFGASGEGQSINNLNEVAFAAVRSVGAEVHVGDVSGRTPVPAALINDLTTDGATFLNVQQNGLWPQSMNDKGQIAFAAFIRRGTGSSTRVAILLADPLPGLSPGNPIMPDLGNPLPRGWRFPLSCNLPEPCLVGGVGSRRYIDPPLAVGYTYQVEAPGPNFSSVYIPAPLANGDDTFQVEFNGQVAVLKAGVAFDFTAVVPGGVSTFRITGIDTAEALDPSNAAAFVTGLTFATDTTTDYSVTMVPIVADPNDTDLDGVPNASDLCPNTAPGATVDSNGCSASQRDSDGDGVVDSLDQCPATPLGTPVDAKGCSALQLDTDGDGVPNTADACPNTPPGAAVNSAGCALSQLDSDGDGVNDAVDQCPNTPAGTAVNAVGCALSQLDSDGDGVSDAIDQCPNTPAGAAVNAIGCAQSQLDSDGDGVSDAIDQCPNTLAGAAVNAVGCAQSQLDSDGDGVPDSIDACPGTAAGTAVDSHGCPLVVQPPQVCDIDGNKVINYKDIAAILLSLGKKATGTGDPRDANGDGKITLTDAAICTKRCDRLLCR